MVTVILCVFLLSYTYGEGKSNYFKGSILILAYLVVMAGFYLWVWHRGDYGRGTRCGEQAGDGNVLDGGADEEWKRFLTGGDLLWMETHVRVPVQNFLSVTSRCQGIEQRLNSPLHT
jgi:hypothetical protein